MENLNKKSKVKTKNRSLGRPIFSIIVIAAILSVMGCDLAYAMIARLKYPNPDDYSYQNLSFQIQVKSINHSLDAIGFKEAHFSLPYYVFSREGAPDSILLYHYFMQDFPQKLHFKITKSDTHTVYYNTGVNNYTGYKQENGGDASILSLLDSLGQWKTKFIFDVDKIILSSGDTISAVSFTKIIPDTITESNRLNIEILFDIDSLFSIDQPSGNAYVRKSKISCRKL